MSDKVVLMMDRRYIEAHPGESLLQAARRNNIFIPTLCFLEGLSGVGACRLCLVEVKGIARLLPACLTKAQQGMEVVTNSERLQRHRRTILDMLFSERNHICSVCVSNAHCELQDLAQKLGMTHVDLPYRFPKLPVDSSVLVTQAGFLGGQYLSIEPGGSPDRIKPGGEIENTQGSIDLIGLLGKAMFSGTGAGAGTGAGTGTGTGK